MIGFPLPLVSSQKGSQGPKAHPRQTCFAMEPGAYQGYAAEPAMFSTGYGADPYGGPRVGGKAIRFKGRLETSTSSGIPGLGNAMCRWGKANVCSARMFVTLSPEGLFFFGGREAPFCGVFAFGFCDRCVVIFLEGRLESQIIGSTCAVTLSHALRVELNGRYYFGLSANRPLCSPNGHKLGESFHLS